MLIVKYQNSSINAQRPEAPTKTFGSDDCPHGTDSVMYKAAKVLKQNNPALNIMLPTFKPEEITAKIAAKKAELVVSQVMKDEEPTQEFEIKLGSDVLCKVDLGSKESLDKIDELMGKEPVRSMLKSGEEQKQKVSMMGMPGQTFCATEQEAKDKILDEKKDIVAKSIVEKRIEECLDVPTLSDEFKAQFTTFEAPAMP